MSSRRAQVTVISDAGSVVSGYGTREELIRIRHRPPVWSTIWRGWCIQTGHLDKIVEELDVTGFDVTVTDVRKPNERKARLFRLLEEAPAPRNVVDDELFTAVKSRRPTAQRVEHRAPAEAGRLW